MTLMPRSPTPNSSLIGVIMPRTMLLSTSSMNTTRPSTHMGSANTAGSRTRRRHGGTPPSEAAEAAGPAAASVSSAAVGAGASVMVHLRDARSDRSALRAE